MTTSPLVGCRWLHQHVHAQVAKDVPDDDFLTAVAETIDLGDEFVANRWDVGAVLSGHPELVGNAIEPPIRLARQKIVLAKARRLIDRGLIEGCACGCRGDFALPDPDRPMIVLL